MALLPLTRNFGICAHIDAGKTTTSERILFLTGKIHAIGDIDKGTTALDDDPDEQAKGITINSAATTTFWKRHGIDYTLNLIDTPGHVDFTIEVERSLRVLDGAVAVFDGKEGVEAQSETVWRQADRYGVPRICFINKMDKLGADFQFSFNSIVQRLGVRPVAVQLPIGAGHSFQGVIDLIDMRAFYFLPVEGSRNKEKRMEERDIPADLIEAAHQWRARLIEAACDMDDALAERYLAEESLDPAQIRAALRKGVIAERLFPVLCGAALQNVGVRQVIDAVIDYLPAPMEVPQVQGTDPRDKNQKLTRPHDASAPFSALVFKIVPDKNGDLTYARIYSGRIDQGTRVINSSNGKREMISRIYEMHASQRNPRDHADAGDIVAFIGLKHSITGDTLCDPAHPIVLERMAFSEPVLSLSIEPKTQADKEKLAEALADIRRQDPSFRTSYNQETGQTLIAGMGELHLEIITRRLTRDHKVAVSLGSPQVAYRETITASAQARGLHKKQNSGAGQFGDCTLTVEPCTADQAKAHGLDFTDAIAFENKIVGGVIPREFIPAIEKGCRHVARSGVLAGYPVQDVKITLTFGSFHSKDSSTLAFELAGRLAFTQAVQNARPVLLEPIMKAVITTPEEFLGNVTGDLNRRRATIQDTLQRGNAKLVTAHVPLSEMFNYVGTLRGMTQGRASSIMEPLAYAQVPANITPGILESISS
jgi:elongation factor G